MTTTTAPMLREFTVRHTIRVLTDITVMAPEGTTPEELDRLAWSKLSPVDRAGTLDQVQVYDTNGDLIYEQDF